MFCNKYLNSQKYRVSALQCIVDYCVCSKGCYGARGLSERGVKRCAPLAIYECKIPMHQSRSPLPEEQAIQLIYYVDDFCWATLPPAMPSVLKVVDTLLAVLVGGGVLGLGRLLPYSVYGFAACFVVGLCLTLLWRHCHRQEVRSSAEQRLRRDVGVSLLPRTTLYSNYTLFHSVRYSRFMDAHLCMVHATTLNSLLKCEESAAATMLRKFGGIK